MHAGTLYEVAACGPLVHDTISLKNIHNALYSKQRLPICTFVPT